MPRLQTPPGYYTATEVKKLLNVSDAVVRSYAQKGKIRYIIPPGRKQGFYSKKDVDNLVNELTAFLNIDEEEHEELTFSAATEEDMQQIVTIGRLIFDPTSTRQMTPPEWQLKALEKNPEISFVLKKDNKVLGYINTVPFTAGNPKLQKCLVVDYLADVNILPDDIETYNTGNHIDLYIMAWATDPELKASDRRWYGGRLVARFISKMEELGRRGVIIDTVASQGRSRSGVRLLQAFSFTEVAPPPEAPHKRTFTLDIQRGYGHAAKQYQEALSEWEQKHREEAM